MTMDPFSLFSWSKTLPAIEKLQKLLQCPICNKLTEEAQCMGRCDHFYCGTCIKTIENSTCPLCSIPSPPGEHKPDNIINSLVASTSDLLTLIKGGTISGNCSQEAKENWAQNNNVATPDVSSITSEENFIRRPNKPLNSILKDSTSKRSSNVRIARQGVEASSDSKKGASAHLKSASSKSTPYSRDVSDSSLRTPKSKGVCKPIDISILGVTPKTPAINKRNVKGESTLHVACIKGDTSRVQNLLVEGANPNTRDNAGWTPLHEACHHGFLQIAENLLKHGALVDVPGNDNETPLHDAVSNGNTVIIALLRQWGASSESRDLFGRTPKEYADKCQSPKDIHAALNTEVDTTLRSLFPTVAPLASKMVLLESHLSPEYKKRLDKLSKLLRMKVASEFSPEVTHIIMWCEEEESICARTADFMMGIVSGKWIISHKWIDECLSLGGFVTPDAFEVTGIAENPKSLLPQRAREKANKMHPGLFNGCHMFLQGSFYDELGQPTKKEVESIITAGGGVVLQREPNPESIPEEEKTVPYHSSPDGPLATCSHYCIYSGEPLLKYDMAHIKSLPLSWLLDCIENNALVQPYI